MKNNTKPDCRNFIGDRPCEIHKKTKRMCDECDLYDPWDEKIWIVKLDSIGDVIRTTFILDAIKIKVNTCIVHKNNVIPSPIK